MLTYVFSKEISSRKASASVTLRHCKASRLCCPLVKTDTAASAAAAPVAAPVAVPATDFTYSQVAFTGPISWPGHIHEGFARLAAYLWASGLREVVDSLVLQQGSSVEHVVVAGHSMGAGVGTLLSYTIQVGRMLH